MDMRIQSSDGTEVLFTLRFLLSGLTAELNICWCRSSSGRVPPQAKGSDMSPASGQVKSQQE